MTYKKLTTTALTLAFLASSASMAFAGGSSNGTSNCQLVYGGGQVCNQNVTFTINKLVQEPNSNGVFVDNVTVNDPNKYTPGQTVVYKIRVQNTANKELDNIKVTDTLPQFVTFVSGNNISYNKSNNTFTYNISSLQPNQTNEETYTAQVVQDSTLPQNEAVICGPEMTNTATAQLGAYSATDQSEICVTRTIINMPQKVFQTPPLKQTPSTGPEMLSLAALIPSGALGVFLKRKSKKI